MKQNLLILGISLLIPILSFSQTTFPKLTKDSLIVLKPLQLKKVNLIFVEHSQLKENKVILENIIALKDSTLVSYEQTLENQNKKINLLNNTITKQNNQIIKLDNYLYKQEFKTRKFKKLTFWGFGISLGLLTLFFIK